MKPSQTQRRAWGRTHLVIPDPHAKPDWNNDRFEWLGKWAADNTPDVIVCIGDWADMASLCQYDKGTASAEGRRYSEDIRSVVESQEKFFAPIRAEIVRRRRGHRKRWEPRFVMCLGNHDARILTAGEKDPVMYGHLKVSDLKFEEFGWEEIPFTVPVVIDGIVYVHYLVSGVMGRAMGGTNHARNLLNKGSGSITVGHSHCFDYAQARAADGRVMHGMVCGVFTDEKMKYAGHQPGGMWWRGVIHKKRVKDGNYSFEQISIEELSELYRDE